MATTQSTNGLELFLEAGRTWIQQWLDDARHARARREVYRATHHALSSLSDRELADLGIFRCDIGQLARQAADR